MGELIRNKVELESACATAAKSGALALDTEFVWRRTYRPRLCVVQFGGAGGESFADVAKSMSADPRSADGGVWKDVHPAEMFKPEIVDALNKLNVGERSDPIELQGWVTIIRKDAEHQGVRRSFGEAYNDIQNTVRAR